jgi:hypothetical protein
MKEACVLPKYQLFYPALSPGRWYRFSDRPRDTSRPEGATRSGGGPVPSDGGWLDVDGTERFVFLHHLTIRDTQPSDLQPAM